MKKVVRIQRDLQRQPRFVRKQRSAACAARTAFRHIEPGLKSGMSQACRARGGRGTGHAVCLRDWPA
ncbi:MAG: hypothetical protein Q8L92_11285 [Rubrivivax sp.]|nr:hypothetical protein [Rubrivivax sp.]